MTDDTQGLDQFLRLAIQETKSSPNLSRLLSAIAVSVYGHHNNISLLNEWTGVEATKDTRIGSLTDRLNTINGVIQSNSGSDGTSALQVPSMMSAIADTDKRIDESVQRTLLLQSSASKQVENFNRLADQLRSDELMVADDQARFDTGLRLLGTRLASLQSEVTDLKAALRLQASLNSTLLVNEIYTHVVQAKATRVVVRREVEWRRLTVLKYVSSGVVLPRFVTGFANAEAQLHEMHTAFLADDYIEGDEFITLKSFLHSHSQSFKDGIDKFTVDITYDRRESPCEEQFFTVPDPNSFSDVDGTFGTKLTFVANSARLKNFVFETPLLNDFSVSIKGSKLVAETVGLLLLAGVFLLPVTGVTDALATFVVEGTGFEQIGKRIANKLLQIFGKKAAKQLTDSLAHPDYDAGVIRGETRSETETGELRVAMAYPSGTQAWNTEPEFLPRVATANGYISQYLYTEPIMMTMVSDTEAEILRIGSSNAAVIKDFWIAQQRIQVGTTSKDAIGNDMIAEYDLQIHLGAAEAAGANVIKWGGVPILGKVAGVWRKYNHVDTLFTIGDPI
jgi:hypothetical protein